MKRPLYYTFGNHMHWVDMEWLWGNGTLASSVEDMLRFAMESGAKGQVNFDGIGYEKLAVQDPQAFARLREAVEKGIIEIAGGSYGQPYGLFQGGESNVRQRVYGARTVNRLFGRWPRTFWEEEFDLFPQLPQILRGVGINYASLFFQWTWHTPHLPVEASPAVWWEAMDGSQLLAAPRNDLNLHQWPEEFASLLDSPDLRNRHLPFLVQWLELMPSPDWMCRSELILPQFKALCEHPDFDIRPVNLPEFLELARDYAEKRRYTLDDVFHGFSLGKNGDYFRRLSRQAEQSLLAAESLSAVYAFFGRPYPSWDVYPTWELEEAWRELLSAQHHDNDECEGLCGHIGQRSYERSRSLSHHVLQRTLNILARRTSGSAGSLIVYNPLGWKRRAVVQDPLTKRNLLLEALPAFGYQVIEPSGHLTFPGEVEVVEDGRAISLRRGDLQVKVDRLRGTISQVQSTAFLYGALPDGESLGDIQMKRNGQNERFTSVSVTIEGQPAQPCILVQRVGQDEAVVTVAFNLAPEVDAVDIHFSAKGLPRPDPGFAGALQTSLCVNLDNPGFIHDHPYGVSPIKAQGKYLRKYPTGDWMTSPQVFEDVVNPFTALQFLDLTDGQRGLLFLHDGSQAYLRRGETARQVLTLYDPWDEDYFVGDLDVRMRVVPHGPLTNADRWRLAQEFNRPALAASAGAKLKDRVPFPGNMKGDLPVRLEGIGCDASGIVMAAFYREMEESGGGLDHYAGQGIGYPYILRLVELNGAPAQAGLRLPGRVQAVFRTNLLGEIREKLPVTFRQGPEPLSSYSQLSISMGAYEIATLYLDLELGHKVYRDLDAERKVWATVHRV